MALTAAPTPLCSLAIIDSISSVDCWVRLARLRTSSATTAKPRPCSPARAASIAALRASKLVCSAIPLITSSTRLMEALSAGQALNAADLGVHQFTATHRFIIHALRTAHGGGGPARHLHQPGAGGDQG